MNRKLTDKQIKEFDEQAWLDQKAAIKCKRLRQSILIRMVNRVNYWRVA
jgi:hypothetical protein